MRGAGVGSAQGLDHSTITKAIIDMARAITEIILENNRSHSLTCQYRLVLSQPPNNNYPNRLAEGRSKAIGPTLRFQTLPIPRLTEY